MSRYLFLNFPAAGHVNPTLAIVEELQTRGEEVYYLLPEEWRGAIESVGGTFIPLSPKAQLERSRMAERLSPDDRIALLPYAMARQAPHAVPEIVSSVRACSPDCLVINSMDLWAKLAARITDIRAVGFRPFHAPPGRPGGDRLTGAVLAGLARQADRALEILMASYAMPAVTLSELRAAIVNPTLIFMPRAFQAGGEEFDDRFVFVGPSLLEPGPLPADLPVRPGAKHVLISLGTLRNQEPEFYRLCLAGLGGAEWQVFMSIGSSVDPAALGPMPGNCIVRPRLPQTALLPHMDLFISHGGLNSVMESLYDGVPLVVLPLTLEQRLTAVRVAQLRLGTQDDLHAMTREKLVDLARQVIDDTEIRHAIAVMQQRTRESGGYRLAADTLMRAAAKSP
jgi:MGT family glycosyltransferase